MNTDYSLRERIRRFFESIPRKVAWMLPPSVAMWAGMRVIAHATTGKYAAENVSSMTAMMAIARWNDDKITPASPEEEDN